MCHAHASVGVTMAQSPPEAPYTRSSWAREGAHLQPERRIMIDIGSDCVAARVPTVQYVLVMSTDCPLSRLTLNSSVCVCVRGCASKQRLIGFVWGFQMRCLPLFTLVIDSIAAFLFHLSLILSLPFPSSCFPVRYMPYNWQGTFLYTFFCVWHNFLAWCVPHFLIMHTHVFEIYSAQTSIRLKAVEVDKDFPFFHDAA